MRTGRPKSPLVLTAEERSVLESYVRRHKTAQRLALRARIVLRCADGLDNEVVARELRIAPATVCKWRARFVAKRLDGLLDEPRPGAPRRIGDEQVERAIALTLESAPEGATHWSTREMARRMGFSHSTVNRIWRAFGLQPHRTKTFTLSRDPLFIDKVRDIVGLYLDPPDNALVLSVDEKSQIQALNRTQPLLPFRPGQVERRTPDYERHGTTSLFAALDVAAGTVIGQCRRRHRAVEFRKFLDAVDEAVPPALEVHIIMDNYATHKASTVRNWFAKRPRYHIHFTPTHASWLNQVERWFALLSERQIKRGSHRSTRALEQAITEFVAANNSRPKPFAWTKTADEILASVRRFCLRTLKDHGVTYNSQTSDTGH